MTRREKGGIGRGGKRGRGEKEERRGR